MTSPDLARERSSICSARASAKHHRLFAIVGLFAALSVGSSVQAQNISPTPRAPKVAPPPVTAPATPVQTPVAPSSAVSQTQTSPAVPPSSSTSTTTTTSKQWEPALSGSTPTTRTESTTVTGPTPAPTPIVDQPAQPSSAPVVVVDPQGQLEAKRTEEKLEIKEKLTSIDERLEHLDRQREERGRITGPVSMLTAGYTTGLAALAVSLGAFYGAERVADTEGYKRRLDINDDNQLDADDENSFRTIARTMGALSAVGFGVGIAGSIFLAKRLKERRELDPDVRRLQNERRELRRELNYTLGPVKNGVALGMTGRF